MFGTSPLLAPVGLLALFLGAASQDALAQQATTLPAAPEPVAAEQVATTAPAQISTSIISPAFVDHLRQELQVPVTILSVYASNKRHEGVQQAEIDTLDNDWKAQAKSDDQPLIAEILSSPLSSYLLYTQAKSAGLFTEVFVMDKFGLNVGQSSVTSDYWQGDEGKFQKTYNVGPDAVFIDDPEFNDETKTWRTQVNFTLVDPASKESVGAITAEINLTELQRRIDSGMATAQ